MENHLLSKSNTQPAQMVQGATLGAIFLAVFGLFSSLGGYFKGNIVSWQDYILLITPTIVFALGLVSLVLLRRGKVLPGSSLVFVTNLLLPVVAIMFQAGLGRAIFVYALTSSILLIWRTMPRTTRNWTLVLTVLTLALVIAMEWINPSMRVAAGDELSMFFYAASAALGAIFLVQFVRRAWSSNIRVKLITAFTLMALVAVSIVGTVSYINYRKQIRADIRQRLLNIVSLVAMNQDGDLHATIHGPGNIEDDSYKTILSQHQNFLATDPDLIYTYTMRKNEQGQIYFVIDARQGGEPGRDPPGTIYDEPSELLSTQFDTLSGPVVEEDIYTDKYGAVLPSYAPFYRSDGTREGIVGVDIRAGSILAQERAALIQILITTAIALALVTSLGLYLGTLFTKPITNLSSVAQKITAGDLSARAKIETTDEVGDLAKALNEMTSQLQGTLFDLEQRVAARTKDLATVAEVSTATATIQKTDLLLQEVVDLTKERFNLYHSHIYLLDDAGENLVLAAGAGEPGQKMVAEGRSIPLSREQSLVARAGRERKGVTVNDVTLEPDFLPNPLLPDTRAELAVPMLVGNTLVGVFDIQSEVVGRFTEADISVQTALAAQLATSIQNVRSYEKTRAQAELETLVNAIGQKIQRATSVQDTLQIAIREVGQVLGASRVSVSLGTGQKPDDSKPSPDDMEAS